jgi:hypothetical protein
VEAERDAGRQVDAGGRLAGEVLCGEDDRVGRAVVGVADAAELIASFRSKRRGG